MQNTSTPFNATNITLPDLADEFNLADFFDDKNLLWAYARILLFALIFRALDYPILFSIIKRNYGDSSARRRWRIRNETTSLIHATISGSWALATFVLDHDIWKDMIDWFSTYAYWLTLFSIGYFVHDAIDLVSHERSLRVLELLFHHVSIVFAFMCGVTTHRFVALCACGLLMELNSICLHSRSLLNLHAVDRQSIVYRLVSVSNVASFIVFRLSTTFYMLVWDLLHFDQMEAFYFGVLFFVMFSLLCVNLILFYRVLLADAYVQPPPASCLVSIPDHGFLRVWDWPLVPPPVWQYLPTLRQAPGAGAGAAGQQVQLEAVVLQTVDESAAEAKEQHALDAERQSVASRESAYMSVAGDVIMGTDNDIIP